MEMKEGDVAWEARNSPDSRFELAAGHILTWIVTFGHEDIFDMRFVARWAPSQKRSHGSRRMRKISDKIAILKTVNVSWKG